MAGFVFGVLSLAITTPRHLAIPRHRAPLPRAAELAVAPPLNVVIMAVGTRGDIVPFLAMAERMREEHGHRIRIATHEHHRSLVTGSGHEFYPLAGDPKLLAAWAADFSCRPQALLKSAVEVEASQRKLAMQRDICFSTWPACTAADPADPTARPFHADAIIANPPCHGHIHVAEKLGVPLHLMFPQPWVPTSAFPHPFAGWPVPGATDTDEGGASSSSSWRNRGSFALVDGVLHLALLPTLHEFRTRILGLPPLALGASHGNLMEARAIPFAKMFSPSVLPKPDDWPEHVDVVGAFFAPRGSTASQVDETQPEIAELLTWLEQGPPPVLVGFGSMVLDDAAGAALLRLVVEAAEAAGVRVLLQSGYSRLGGGASGSGSGSGSDFGGSGGVGGSRGGGGGGVEDEVGATLPSHAHAIGPCPHDWLLSRVSALVHHGGAGTLSAGLSHGLPTLACPFFGDQHTWGAMLVRRGAGPPPIPIGELTVANLAASLQELKRPEIRAAARRLAAAMAREDGVAGGVEAFHRHLPLARMRCDVSGGGGGGGDDDGGRGRLARVAYPELGLKVSDEVAAVVEPRWHAAFGTPLRREPHTLKDWRQPPPQRASGSGGSSGSGGGGGGGVGVGTALQAARQAAARAQARATEARLAVRRGLGKLPHPSLSHHPHSHAHDGGAGGAGGAGGGGRLAMRLPAAMAAGDGAFLLSEAWLSDGAAPREAAAPPAAVPMSRPAAVGAVALEPAVAKRQQLVAAAAGATRGGDDAIWQRFLEEVAARRDVNPSG